MAKKSTKKKAVSKKTTKRKVQNLSQAHGKEEKFKPTTLDQIWGDDGTSRYRTLDVEEYTKNLNDLARVDLQAHAVKVGLIPIDNAEQLKKRLITEFRKYVANYKIPDKKISNKALDREAMKTLAEGK